MKLEMKTIWALQPFISNKSHNHTYLLNWGGGKNMTKKVFELKSELSVLINPKAEEKKIL